MEELLYAIEDMVYGYGRTPRDVVKFVDVLLAMWPHNVVKPEDVLLTVWSSQRMYCSLHGQVRGCTPHYMVKFVDVLLVNVFKERPYRPKLGPKSLYMPLCNMFRDGVRSSLMPRYDRPCAVKVRAQLPFPHCLLPSPTHELPLAW